MGDDPPRGPLRLLGVRGARAPRVDFSAPWAVACAPTLGTERTALGGIGVAWGAVQTAGAHGPPPHCVGGQEAGDPERCACWQHGGAHVGHGVMSRREAARQAVNWLRVL